ncbi:lipopolysaccharide assembly protein LapA domain-containing protein [Endozoicomonas sp. Mp262]|uniref:lipopolysaccharide assembly protein LapA domain-containing protein n=1 Tax=Endozoicomonas sp. Mp262 TaxID=2919499 RepID=UPI0021DA2088
MMTALVVWMKRGLLLVLLLILLVFMVSFATSNTSEVHLQLLGWDLMSIKTASLAVMSFIAGGVVGIIVSVVSISRLQLKNSSLMRKLARRDKELQKLRSSSLKGLTDA